MPDPHPPANFGIGERVLAPCQLTSEKRIRMHKGTIESRRWDDEEGWGRKAGWTYGVALDAGGGCRTDEPDIQRFDVVTELGDLING